MHGFGLKIIAGMFGRGKTKNIYQRAFEWKRKNPNGILIANLPYDFVDIHYNSKEDLQKIVNFLRYYIRQTNNFSDLYEFFFPDIYIIVDEAHNYYFSRDFKKFDKESMMILTQCRKRRIAVDYITQSLSQLDVFMRRLSPIVEEFVSFPLGFQKSVIYELNNPESPQLGLVGSQNVELSTKIIFPSWFQRLFRPYLQKYFDQRRISLFVVGDENILNMDQEDFLAILHSRRDIEKENFKNRKPIAYHILDRFRKLFIKNDLKKFSNKQLDPGI